MNIFFLRLVFGFIFIFGITNMIQGQTRKTIPLYSANNSKFQYVGRIDFTKPELPRFWSPGVYIRATFYGSTCEIIINDEMLWGKAHNYISVAVDNLPVKRIKLTNKVNTIKVSEILSKGRHTVLICKGTESGIGYLEFVGLRCEKLLKPDPLPKRKIEFYGNSITCGTGSDLSEVPCDKAEWYDQHNAFMSYGPVMARSLNAQWMLSSVSGIGLVHSCCNMDIVMPDVYDKVNMRTNEMSWDFTRYQPDVVTVALGQNDGIQDSAYFCSRYVEFMHSLRKKYPSATLVCITSPMADATLTSAMKKYLTSVVNTLNSEGDKNVFSFFFSRSYNNGCGGHPDLTQHTEIANELVIFIKKMKKW